MYGTKYFTYILPSCRFPHSVVIFIEIWMNPSAIYFICVETHHRFIKFTFHNSKITLRHSPRQMVEGKVHKTKDDEFLRSFSFLHHPCLSQFMLSHFFSSSFATSFISVADITASFTGIMQGSKSKLSPQLNNENM